MTQTHFEKQLEDVKQLLLKMAGLVEEAIDRATRALVSGDVAEAKELISDDERIDEMENEVEEACLKLLATQQPVAVDLRFITTAMRNCANLERMGDRAVNLGYRTLSLSEVGQTRVPEIISQMATVAQSMVKNCLDAFVNGDVDLAFQVICTDDDLDNLNRSLMEEMIRRTNEDPGLLRTSIELILAGRHLERIGDEATNVSEEVVFLVEGRSIKHQETEICYPPELNKA